MFSWSISTGIEFDEYVYTSWRQFTINNVDKNATIIFSYTGFSSQTIKLNGQTTLNISLKPESFKLNDVVVTGYSRKKRSN
jgi:hypothetical protein